MRGNGSSRSTSGPHPIGRRTSRRPASLVARATVVAVAAALLPPLALIVPAAAQTSTITVTASDLTSGDPLVEYSFVINADNTALPSATNPLNRPGLAPTESNAPLVAVGDQDNPTVTLPDGRYLISLRSTADADGDPDTDDGYKMWGQHITLPDDAGDIDIALRPGPFPLGKIVAWVFEDNAWTNSAPDVLEPGLEGFEITIEEQTDSVVTVDYFNNPLCGGVCLTDAGGFATLENLGPATYHAYATPPDGPCNDDPNSYWVQTSTFEGGFGVTAGVEEGSDGLGAPGEQLWEGPDVRTAHWFGFTCVPTTFADPGTASISGRALNWAGWPPFDNLIPDPNEPVRNAYLTLSDAATDTTVFAGQADGDGNFTILDVPAGSYTLSVWDEQLEYIIRFLPVEAPDGEAVDLGDVGVSRWFGWVEGDVYVDTNLNGIRDPGEEGIPNYGMDLRWRDGSIKAETFTDTDGHYVYPQAEGGPLGTWFIGEVGFRLGTTGASVHDEYTGAATPVPDPNGPEPTAFGGGLLTNQLVTEGHHARVDWGQYDYTDFHGDLPGPQIVGITIWAITRNEYFAQLQAAEPYEPGIPDVAVLLESAEQLGPDLLPDTGDEPPWTSDFVLNTYSTDHWQHPNVSQGAQQACDVRDANGNDISGDHHPLIGPNCLEVPVTGVETKDGGFDGGYAFADYCPNGFDVDALDPDNFPCWNATHDDHVALEPLVPGSYVTHAVMPKNEDDLRECNDPATGTQKVSEDGGEVQTGCLYRVVREEDVNVDSGAAFVPQIPPPDCVGDLHTIDQATTIDRSPFDQDNPDWNGITEIPLCDKKLVELLGTQSANADFMMMTNFQTGPDVQIPGRITGLVTDDIYFDNDPQSIWYGEARPIGNIPVGIRDYDRRLITTVTTDENGYYEVLLPSAETFNCPIPQGPCPGMYVVVVNDPGDLDSPNPNYNPNYLTAGLAWDVWPGLTTQLDTPLDPISGAGCDLEVGTPELLQVSRAYVRNQDNTAALRRITIQGAHFGTTPGTVTLTDPRGGTHSRTLGPAVSPSPTLAAGGIVSWADRQIVIQVPVTSTSYFPGQKTLSIRTAGASVLSTTNGITIHVLAPASPGIPAYNPQRVQILPPTSPHAIQEAIDDAPTNALLLLDQGTYHENVLVWKRLKIQGLGPGGIVGAPETELQTQPEDPRFTIQGSVIDGRFFQDTRSDPGGWDEVVADHAPYVAGDGALDILAGADITVVAQSTSAYNVAGNVTGVFNAARVDGVGLMTGRGEGAGGIQLQAYANNVQITNDVLESNGGVLAGGIGVGQPYRHIIDNTSTDVGSHNYGLRVQFDRLIGNGGLFLSGAMGIFNGSNNYQIANDIFCANFGVEYGAGIAHWGMSPGGVIRDSQIYYNDSVDSGAGISIQQEVPAPSDPPVAGVGSGNVDVLRNLIQSNYSGDDGGGMFVANALGARINIVNNMIVDNGAAHVGGAITIDDSKNVAIVNNTIANNVSTASGESSDDTPHSAGLASEADDPLYYPGGGFSNPVALFNNIFWENEAFTLSGAGPGAVLLSEGFIDLEIFGTGNPADTFTPRYSLLTDGTIVTGDGSTATVPGGQGNTIGVDPLFIEPFTLELTVFGSRLDPQVAAVTITGHDPDVGLTGNYHLQTSNAAAQASGAVDRGVRCSNTPFPVSTFPNPPCGSGVAAPTGPPPAANQPGDIDGQNRPVLRTTRTFTRWDLGADEVQPL